jgi:hypothetical protein
MSKSFCSAARCWLLQRFPRLVLFGRGILNFSATSCTPSPMRPAISTWHNTHVICWFSRLL